MADRNMAVVSRRTDPILASIFFIMTSHGRPCDVIIKKMEARIGSVRRETNMAGLAVSMMAVAPFLLLQLMLWMPAEASSESLESYDDAQHFHILWKSSEKMENVSLCVGLRVLIFAKKLGFEWHVYLTII